MQTHKRNITKIIYEGAREFNDTDTLTAPVNGYIQEIIMTEYLPKYEQIIEAYDALYPNIHPLIVNPLYDWNPGTAAHILENFDMDDSFQNCRKRALSAIGDALYAIEQQFYKSSDVTGAVLQDAIALFKQCRDLIETAQRVITNCIAQIFAA